MNVQAMLANQARDLLGIIDLVFVKIVGSIR